MTAEDARKLAQQERVKAAERKRQEAAALAEQAAREAAEFQANVEKALEQIGNMISARLELTFGEATSLQWRSSEMNVEYRDTLVNTVWEILYKRGFSVQLLGRNLELCISWKD